MNGYVLDIAPRYTDFALAGLVLASITIARFIVPYYILGPLLRSRVTPQDQLGSACDHCIKLLMHGTLFLWGMSVIPREAWLMDMWHPTKDIWVGFPATTMSISLQRYYQAQLAFYCSGIIFHFLETKRRDYWVMLFHHICTAGLIAGSYICCYHRIGCLVLITREFSDILLHLTKVAVFLGYSELKTVGFLSLMISWIPLRLFMYPYSILWSTMVDAPRVMGYELLRTVMVHYVGFNIALFCLLPLDWYYFVIGMQVGIRRLKTGALSDSLEISVEGPKKSR